ncbi:MAG: glycosyltransferase family 87 protein [Candidatus Binataceae bacterium]
MACVPRSAVRWRWFPNVHRSISGSDPLIPLQTWHNSRYRRTAIALACVAAVIDLAAIALRRMRQPGDFDVSMELGRRFVHGEPLYRGGLHFPYLPAAAMFFSALSLLPKPLAFAILYSLAIASLWLIMRMLAAMRCETDPGLRERGLPIAIATLILASHYILRDLDDGGPNIILLALVLGGVYLAWTRREIAAAGCLGAATALKATMGIFIPFLLWKRRWRLAAYSATAAVFWLALPALWMGPLNWWVHQRQWIQSAAGFAVGLNPAAAHYYGAHNIRNQALGPAIEHLMAVRSWAIPISGPAVSAASALVIAGIFCWHTRRLYGERLELEWLAEASGLLILAALLAPIAWVQHLVLAIPAIYLIVADWVAKRNFGVAAGAAMVLYIVLALLLNRTILGKARYLVLLDYHIHTVCMLLLLGVLMMRYRVPSGQRG